MPVFLQIVRVCVCVCVCVCATSVPLVSNTESESVVSGCSRPASMEAWAATMSLSG